jgi:hypothetical protein
VNIFSKASIDFLTANPGLKPHPSNHGKVRIGKRGGMNKTESEFGMMLEAQKRKGEILRYEYQGITLRWGVDSKTGDSMRYTPDFIVIGNCYVSGYPVNVRIIEVKGPHIHYHQQAIARFKGCRSDWPEFQFEMWQRQKSGWKQIL